MTIQTPLGAYVKELRKERTRTSKTFDMGKNKRRLIKSLAPVHYKNRAGKFRTIDTTIRQDGKNFVVDRTDFDLSILSDQVGYSYTSKRGGDVTVRLLELDGAPVKDLKLNIAPRLDGDKLWYDEVLPGLDIYIEVRPLQVQVWKIIKTKDAAHEFKWLVKENNTRKKFTVRDKTEGTDNHNGERGHGRGKRGLKRKLEIIPKRKDFDDHFTFKETITTRTAKKDKRTRRKNWAKGEIVYPLLVDQDIIENIVANEDDGMEFYYGPPISNTGWNYTDVTNVVGALSTTATTTTPTTTTFTYSLSLQGGVRFRQLNIQQGSIINSAILKLKIDGAPAGTLKSQIYGDNVDDALQWSAGNRPSGITKTTAKTATAGIVAGWNSLDVTAQVQEIVNRGGWLENNDLRFGLLNTGVATQYFIFYDYASGAANAAILEIDYTTPAVSIIVSRPELSSGAANYSIWLLSPLGKRLKLIDRFTALKYTLASNGIGVAKLTLPPTFPLDWVQEDSQLLIYRQIPGAAKYRDGNAVWFIRDWDWGINQQGEESINLLAYSANEILDRAIIAYAAGTSQASKSSLPVDNFIKALVRENLGSLATDTDRDKSTYLLVDADVGLGPTASKSMAWRKLLPTIRDLAQDADEAGTPIFFDVVRRSGESLLSFATYANQRGVDRGSTSGNRVILSVQNGTLSEVRWSYASRGEKNYIYVGGGGQESVREIVEVEAASRLNISPFARNELFKDARSKPTGSLTSEGEAAIRQYRPRETFSAKIRDTKATRFGREYEYGSIVVADHKIRSLDVRVDAIEIGISNGKESIRVQLRAV